MPDTALDLGRSAFAEHRWSDAYDCFARAEAEGGLPPQDLELMASVAVLLGHNSEGIELLTRAHEEFLVVGEMSSAARCATWLVLHLMRSGETARGSGWMGRAKRLVDEMEEPGQAAGFLLIPMALGALYGGDPSAAHELFSQAFAIGRSVRDRDLMALGQLGLGTARLTLGFPDEGLELLDEVMLAVTAGEVSPIPSGMIYCGVIGSCRLANDVHRAQEWTAALDRWCGGRPDMVMFTGLCQSYRAELFILHGAWDDALRAARTAQDLAGHSDPEAAYNAWYQQGEVLRLRGQFEAAESCYLKAGQTGYEPLPGLALLRVAQHRAAQAQGMLRRAIAGADPANRSRLLPALVDVELAAGDVAAARSAADEISRSMSRSSRPMEQALSAQAEASVLVAEGEAGMALEAARRAWRLWFGLEAPYLAACCRILAGRACAALGDRDSAAMEFEAAKVDLAEIGAQPAVAEVLRFTAEDAGARNGPLTARELDVLRLVAEGKPNRDIARTLYLSDKTVARHVSNILTKLGLASRTAATKYAFEHDVVR